MLNQTEVSAVQQYTRAILAILIAAPLVSADVSPKTDLETLLSPSIARDQRDAFDAFVANPQQFIPQLKEILSSYTDAPLDLDRLNAVFYLAAYTKDASLASPIMDVVNRFTSSDEQESELGCIYMCPVVFALVIFDSCTDWSLPEPPAVGYGTVLYDARRDIDSFQNQPLVAEHAKEHSSGVEAWNARLEKVAAMTYTELLKAAGEANPDTDLRFAAAFELQYRTVTSDYLDELYWLAITGEKFERDVNDASMQYRDAICRAIYRAERAKQLGR
jgi:hypothetical protein